MKLIITSFLSLSCYSPTRPHISLPYSPSVPPFYESYKQDGEFLNIAIDSNRSGSCGQWRTEGGGGSNPPPRNSEGPPNSTRL